MNIQIVNTGSELMLGRVLNTHQQWLCRRLSDIGYVVDRQVAVDDGAPAIEQAVREALTVGDLVITTGGLGPTSDDRTRDLIAGLLGRKLETDATVLRHIEGFFSVRKRRMPDRVAVQALVPEGAIVLQNAFGTAPGLVLEVPPRKTGGVSGLLVMLPGPPRELRPMFDTQVEPLIRSHFAAPEMFLCRTFRTTGLGESLVEAKIAEPLRPLSATGLEIGYCARPGEVDVRFVTRGAGAQERMREAERILRQTVGELVFGMEDEELEDVVVRMLTERHRTLALAESCTGGLLAHRLTNVPGASAVLLAGLVTYSNEAKQSFLGVRPETLTAHGAVSEATALEMARGARDRSGADYALSITGIAGPSGGSEEKPVGTVFIGLAEAGGTRAKRFQNPYDRQTFKAVTTQQALDLLRRFLLQEP